MANDSMSGGGSEVFEAEHAPFRLHPSDGTGSWEGGDAVSLNLKARYHPESKVPPPSTRSPAALLPRSRYLPKPPLCTQWKTQSYSRLRILAAACTPQSPTLPQTCPRESRLLPLDRHYSPAAQPCPTNRRLVCASPRVRPATGTAHTPPRRFPAHRPRHKTCS